MYTHIDDARPVSRSGPPASSQPGSPSDISARIERLPFSTWHVKARVLIGTATFFDAFDALTIAQVLPVLAPLWKLTSGQIGVMIATGYLGQLIGALLFSWIAEKHGRVWALMIAMVTFTTMSLACMAATNYDWLLVFRTLQGLGLGGEVPIAAVYISEVTRARGRGRFVLLYELIFSVGVVAAGAIGYWVIPHLGWRYMFLVGTFPILLLYWLYRWPESPRWLAGRGRYGEADAALSDIERQVRETTGRPLPDVQDTAIQPIEKRSSWAELFAPAYLRRTLVVWSIWFGSYIVYYGIGTWLPTLYRTVFQLPLEQSLRYGLISNGIGFIGATVCALTIDYVGRKIWFSLSLGGAGLFLAAMWLGGIKDPMDVLLYGSGAYFFATAAAVGVYLYTPELYPTRVRAIGVGTATAWLRLASMAGPLIIGSLISYGLGYVFAVFGAVALLAAIIVALYAVETKERVLEELSP